MYGIKANPGDLPAELRAAVKAVAPASARRKTWFVHVRDSVTIPYCSWDGGSKTEYSGADIGTARYVQLPEASTPAGHFSHPSSWVEPEYEIPDHVVVVQHGTSCGKAAFPRLTISPACAQRLGIKKD